MVCLRNDRLDRPAAFWANGFVRIVPLVLRDPYFSGIALAEGKSSSKKKAVGEAIRPRTGLSKGEISFGKNAFFDPQ